MSTEPHPNTNKMALYRPLPGGRKTDIALERIVDSGKFASLGLAASAVFSAVAVLASRDRDLEFEAITKDIAKRMGMSPKGVSKGLRELEAAGVIKRLTRGGVEYQNGRILSATYRLLTPPPVPQPKQFTRLRVGCLPERKPAAGYIYAISHEGLVKIGRTVDLKSRMRDVMGSHPKYASPSPVWTVRVLNPPKVERKLHVQFGLKRIAGEWFDLTEGEIEAARQMAEKLKEGA